MKQVLDYVQKHHLIEAGDRVVIGLSGGADSVCLLFVLQNLRQVIDFSICAVHINHNLRGKEALRDAAFVENLCKEQQIPLKMVSCPVSNEAKARKIGTEEAGRQLRYEAFEQYAKEFGATKIALAHHQNDLAETMIHHLARGTDLAGLSAIRPMRGKYIRPFLCVDRRWIEAYLAKRELIYVTDSTNAEDCYTRNRIRHHVIEYLEKEVNEQTAVHMSETAESLGEIYEYLLASAKEKLEQYGTLSEKGIYLEQGLFEEHKVLVSYVLRLAIKKLADGLKDITRQHLSQVSALCEKEVGKTINLPYGIIVTKEYTGIRLQKKETLTEKEKPKEKVIDLLIPGEVNWNGYLFVCSLETGNMEEIPEKTYTKWLDYDKIKGNLVLRFRENGDYIVINDQGGKKKLKDYFIDKKIPKDQRDQIPLVCMGQEVLWVCGYRISEAYKIKKETKNVLKIQLQGGRDHE